MMVPLIALWLALLASQTTTPPTPPPSDSTAAQSAPQTAPSISAPNQTAPVKPCGVDASGKNHVGCGVTPPRVIYQVQPQFSKEARKSKINGMTLVSLTVDQQGNPINVHIGRSIADAVDKKHRKAALTLDENALEAVKTYRFAPATFEGKPVAVELNVEVNFRIF
jgi:TonB family protein